MNQDLHSLYSIDGNLSQLKDSELHILLRNRVADERKLTDQILLLIAEVDSRKLYLPMAYPSLFEYLVHGIGHTPASAQRRIDAARLMKQVTELGDKIESGSIKLTQVSQVQQVLRPVEKRDKTQLLPSEKKELPHVDQLQPRFAGGGNEPTNLRHLCAQHNQYRYRAGC